MILAQYTIRSKQDYIFRTNKIVEIVGASANISNSWNLLFETAEKIGLTFERADKNEFNYQRTKEQMDGIAPTLNLVELFVGGGNLTVIFDSKESFVKLNKEYSFDVLKNLPGLIPMAVYTDVTGDYKADYACLMSESEIEKNRMNPGRDNFILPFSQMDRNTFQPYSGEMTGSPADGLLSYESISKRKVGVEIRDTNQSIKFLDNMVSGKGKESILAVVHADGNNMGSKIMTLLKDENDYDRCVNKMRSFTITTSKAFSEAGLKAMERCYDRLVNDKKNQKLKEKMEKNKNENPFAYRVVVADGDDFTFICNGRFAMDYTQEYIRAVSAFESDFKYSSCAGICLFHSHYPFARAYAFAEQACDDGAKRKVHTGTGESPEEGWVDFHYIHSGIGGDLEAIRYRENTADSMARPWLLTDGKNTRSYDRLIELEKTFKECKVSRSVIKELGTDWESSHSLGRQSLERVCAKNKDEGLKEKIFGLFSNDVDALMRAIYDLSEIIDIWFEEVAI